MGFINESEVGFQPWYNESHLSSDGQNISHYHLVNLTNASMTKCYLKVDMLSKLDNSTEYCYSDGESILAGVGSTFQAIAGTILNSLVILALLKNEHLRKEYLTPAIISLSATDLIFSLVTLPMLAHRYFLHDWPFGGSIGDFSCQIFPFLYYGLYMATLWNLVAISAVRCIGVYFPSKLKSKRFRCYSKLVLVLAWLLAYVPLTPGLFGMNGLYGLECKTRKCTVININYWDESPTSLNPKEKLGSNTFIMAGICLVIVNALIYYRLWKHTQKLARMSLSNLKQDSKRIAKEQKFGKMMLIIMALFFATYAPTYLLKKIDRQATKTHPLQTILYQLIQSSCVVLDPLIYILLHEKYRRAIKHLLYLGTGKRISVFDTSADFNSTPHYKSQRAVNQGHSTLARSSSSAEPNQKPLSLNNHLSSSVSSTSEVICLNPGVNSAS